METEDEAQERIDRWNAEQARRKMADRFQSYLERIRVYETAWKHGQWPIDGHRYTA